MKLIQQQAEERDRKSADGEAGKRRTALHEHRWQRVILLDRQEVSPDTRTYTFRLPQGGDILGLGTCQHVQIGFHMKDKMLIRNYTPTRPLLQTNGEGDDDELRTRSGQEPQSLRDGNSTFDLTIKTYFPDDRQPGGALSNILDCIPIGEEVEIRGPVGDISYNGFGNFVIEGKHRHFKRVSLILGGSGITPGYALIARILLTKGDMTQVRVIDANKSEDDILLRDELERFERISEGQLQITHVLSHAGEGWSGPRGHVNAEIIRKVLFGPSQDSVAFLCGPPAMIQKAALPAMKGAYL